MPLWPLLEVLLAVVVLVGFFTQVLNPIFSGKPLFPMFRMKKEDEVLTDVVGEIEKEKLRKAAEDLTKELDELRKRNEPPTTPKEELKDDIAS
jgi:ABC-type bacteriocin/lantibiotic exporter with double-glycine peptidase domain